MRLHPPACQRLAVLQLLTHALAHAYPYQLIQNTKIGATSHTLEEARKPNTNELNLQVVNTTWVSIDIPCLMLKIDFTDFFDDFEWPTTKQY